MNPHAHPDNSPGAAQSAKPPGLGGSRTWLVIGSVAVIAFYTAGFLRTASAAHRLTADERHRPAVSASPTTRSAEVAPSVSPSAPPASAATGSAQPAKVVPTVPPVAVAPAVVTALPVAPVPVAAAVSLPAPVVSAPAAALPAPVETPATPPAPAAPVPVADVMKAVVASVAEKPKYKDGIFYGWGSCRHGDLQASIAIKDGRIIAAAISECHTRYSQNVIAMLPAQVVARQSADVDSVAGATQSADAFYYAVSEALKEAK